MTIAALTPSPWQVAVNSAGAITSGARLYFFNSGGAITPAATYSDAALSIPNSQPVTASSAGVFGPIYLLPQSYYVELRDSSNVLIRAQDNVADIASLLESSITTLQTQVASIVFATAQLNMTSNATLAAIVGLSQTVVVGTYQFAINVSGTATANGGWKVGLKYTTAVLSGMECVARGFTASGLVVQHSTSTTDSASLLASTTAIINGELVGRIVVSTGGSVQVMFAQNASHIDTSSAYVGSSFSLVRTA